MLRLWEIWNYIVKQFLEFPDNDEIEIEINNNLTILNYYYLKPMII